MSTSSLAWPAGFDELESGRRPGLIGLVVHHDPRYTVVTDRVRSTFRKLLDWFTLRKWARHTQVDEQIVQDYFGRFGRAHSSIEFRTSKKLKTDRSLRLLVSDKQMVGLYKAAAPSPVTLKDLWTDALASILADLPDATKTSSVVSGQLKAITLQFSHRFEIDLPDPETSSRPLSESHRTPTLADAISYTCSGPKVSQGFRVTSADARHPLFLTIRKTAAAGPIQKRYVWLNWRASYSGDSLATGILEFGLRDLHTWVCVQYSRSLKILKKHQESLGGVDVGQDYSDVSPAKLLWEGGVKLAVIRDMRRLRRLNDRMPRTLARWKKDDKRSRVKPDGSGKMPAAHSDTISPLSEDNLTNPIERFSIKTNGICYSYEFFSAIVLTVTPNSDGRFRCVNRGEGALLPAIEAESENVTQAVNAWQKALHDSFLRLYSASFHELSADDRYLWGTYFSTFEMTATRDDVDMATSTDHDTVVRRECAYFAGLDGDQILLNWLDEVGPDKIDRSMLPREISDSDCVAGKVWEMDIKWSVRTARIMEIRSLIVRQSRVAAISDDEIISKILLMS